MGPKSSGRQSAAIVYPITYRGHCRSYTSNGSSFGAGADSLYNPANDQIRHNRRESKAGVWVMYVYFHRSNLGYIVGSWRFAPLREKGWEEIWSGWSKRLSDRRGCPFSQCVCGPGLATGGVAWEERARWVDLGSRRRTLVSNLEFVSDYALRRSLICGWIRGRRLQLWRSCEEVFDDWPARHHIRGPKLPVLTKIL